MFDINNEELIMKLVDQKDDHVLIPLYVKIDNDIYSILELDQISRYNPSTFKIGFGTAEGLFIKPSFNSKDVLSFNVVKVFSKYIEKYSSDVRYIVFESGYVSNDDIELYKEEINIYMDMLSTHISKHVEKLRKELIRKQMEENSQ